MGKDALRNLHMAVAKRMVCNRNSFWSELQNCSVYRRKCGFPVHVPRLNKIEVLTVTPSVNTNKIAVLTVAHKC